MTPLVSLAIFGFVPFALLVFWLLPAPRAVLVVTIGGCLFLPMAGFKVQGLPDLSQVSVVSYGLLLGALLFNLERVLSFRFRLIDLPMLIWCLVPFASSISNDLGLYDATSAIFYTAMMYGL